MLCDVYESKKIGGYILIPADKKREDLSEIVKKAIGKEPIQKIDVVAGEPRIGLNCKDCLNAIKKDGYCAVKVTVKIIEKLS
ncbi:MAG: hypothetical protein KA807_17935 [Prolixibacteraceae bacterium]|nr:hypothetical protein [Prolixibacteraceae bacterium]